MCVCRKEQMGKGVQPFLSFFLSALLNFKLGEISERCAPAAKYKNKKRRRLSRSFVVASFSAQRNPSLYLKAFKIHHTAAFLHQSLFARVYV